MLAIISHEKHNPVCPKSNIYLTDHCVSTGLKVETMQEEVTEFFPFIRRQFILKPVPVWLFIKTYCRWCEHAAMSGGFALQCRMCLVKDWFLPW